MCPLRTAGNDTIGNMVKDIDEKELRALFGKVPDEEWRALGREHELAVWRDSNRFCGRCGAPMAPHADPRERAMVCTKCGFPVYPRITPAVIVLVTKGDEILLQRNSHYHHSFWSIVAGFVDPGETLEEAVRREIREEASIEVKNVRYVKSQAWPFPSNIMLGFRAEYASGTLKADGVEVQTSGWFDRGHLPEIPSKVSIARALIDQWIEERTHI